MKLPRTTFSIWVAIGAMVAVFSIPVVAKAQEGATPAPNLVAPAPNKLTQRDANQQVRELVEKSLGDPRAEKAYKKFHDERDLDKKIKLGNKFINKYPTSYHVETAYEELAQAYYSKHDLPDFYACADEGIAKFPNDPTLMAVDGAIMARAYNHTDPDADKKLAKAEKYEERAIELLKTLKTPTGMSEAKFSAYKKRVSATAHSGLGLIYFRQGRFDESVKALQQATQDAASPDATDYLVLGGDYQNLSQFKKAADAFNRCAQISGPLQAGCKQYAESSKKRAAQSQ